VNDADVAVARYREVAGLVVIDLEAKGEVAGVTVGEETFEPGEELTLRKTRDSLQAS
jgi:uncharacterized protein YuzE